MHPQLLEKLTIFGESGCINQLNPNIEGVIVPRQKKGNNDCGICVNEMRRTFARNLDEFMKGNTDLFFDTSIMRCTQANTLLKWLHHNPCSDATMSQA